MKKIIYLFILIIFNTQIIAQINDEVIATVGSKKITAEEFKRRFELTPQLGHTNEYWAEEQKNELLQSIIAEKLWALEAEAMRLDTTEIMKKTFQSIENMYLRDALHQQEIRKFINVSDIEMIQGMAKASHSITAYYLFDVDSSRIFSLYKRLQQGTPFDVLLEGREEKNDQATPLVFNFGEWPIEMENIIYGTEPGKFTPPFLAPTGWFIFRINERIPLSISGEKRDEVLSNVRKVIQDRKQNELTRQFYRKFFADKRVETDGTIFWSIAEMITSILEEKKRTLYNIDNKKELRERTDKFGNVYLDAKDILMIENALGTDTLSMTFIYFDKDPMNVKEFLRRFIFEGFYTNEPELNIVAAQLNSRVKMLIEHELIARDAEKQGLRHLPETQLQIGMWRDSYLAQLSKNSFYQNMEISDEALADFIKRRQSEIDTSKIVWVNIVELLTDSLEVIEYALNEVEKGKSLKDIASVHTKRIWTRENGGEFGFFPSILYGELGRTAARLNVGEIYGPLILDEGYSLFQLIDKKEETPYASDEQGFNQQGESSDAAELRNSFMAKTVELANKYGVQINDNAFNRLQVKNHNMIVYQYMGFGGRLTAVPLTPSWTEWFEPWLQTIQELP